MSGLHPLLSELVGAGGRMAAVPAKEARALAYVRVSTDMQEDKGLSIPAQRKAIVEYAARNGIAVLETYVEAASSYQDESKRVEFLRMFERAKSDPQVSVVLVHESSRFSRHPWRTPQLIGELQDAGVRVVSVTEPEFDVNTVMGMWMQKVTEAKNASYSMEVAFHTRKGMRQNANARDPESGLCYKNGGRPAWGYRTVRKERTDVRGRPRFKAVWELNTEEVAGRPLWEWTRDMLLRAGEGTSLDSLRDWLNGAGLRTQDGNAWSTSTIHSMLEPHMLLQYAGYGTWAVRKKRRREWNEASDWEVVPNAHPAIISEDEARAIGRVRGRARETHRNGPQRIRRARTEASPYLLTGGLFRCKRCGAPMIGHKNRGYSYYTCGTSRYRRGAGCGTAVLLDQSVLESAVWGQVQGWVEQLAAPGSPAVADLNSDLRQAWRGAGRTDGGTARRALASIEKKLGNVRAAIENGVEDVAWANTRLRELHTERRKLEEQLAQAAGEPPTVDRSVLVRYAKDLPRLLTLATDEERRTLVRGFVGAVELDPERREVNVDLQLPSNCVNNVEAAAGVEPANRGFADLCLTTWLRRRSVVW